MRTKQFAHIVNYATQILSHTYHKKRDHLNHGELAQLGERLLCTQEVSGSIPLFSTMDAIEMKSLIQVVYDYLN
jgi:hypothetical protein